MDRDPSTAPSLQRALDRARRSSWGGPEARAELRRICEDARVRAGFEVSAVEVLRGDGFLELVAFCGRSEDREAMGGSYSLALALRVIEESSSYGRLCFLAEEDMDADLQEELLGYGYVPDLPASGDPRRWRPLDMLVARVTDATGRTRALLHLDEPVGGLRPTPAELTQLAADLELLLDALVSTVDREELTRHVRLDETAREVVRTASRRLGRPELLAQIHPQLVSGFRARTVEVHLFEGDDAPATCLPPEAADAMTEAARRAWSSRTVIVAEPDRIWGDDALDREHRGTLTTCLEEHAAQELLMVPVGAGYEAMGMLLVLRDSASGRWTETESVAALGVGHDVGRALLGTRAHEREQQLITELQQLDEYRRQLIATVAHELKNPLGVIAGHVELLEQLPDVAAQASPSLRALHRSASRLDVLVQDLLLLSRIGNPRTPVRRAPVDVGAMLADVAEDEQPRAGSRRVDIAATYDGDLTVDGDAEELRRLLANLVSNAVKYSRDGGSVILGLARVGSEVEFICTDDGIGISPSDQQQLFTEFFRSTNPAALQRPGTGLGLAIAARVVERHGGRIELNSTPDRGTTVMVTLPAD